MLNGWRDMGGCPLGELGRGETVECLVVTTNGEITIGEYGEDWLGRYRWVDPRGRKIEPEAWQNLPDWPT